MCFPCSAEAGKNAGKRAQCPGAARTYLDRAVLYEIAAVDRVPLGGHGFSLPEVYCGEGSGQTRCRLLVQGLLWLHVAGRGGRGVHVCWLQQVYPLYLVLVRCAFPPQDGPHAWLLSVFDSIASTYSPSLLRSPRGNTQYQTTVSCN